MGAEIKGRLDYQAKSSTGTALLESDFLLFRGSPPDAVRLKLFFKDLSAVSARGGCLHLKLADGPATLELGAAAEKWAAKILHPPSLLDKLGVKAGVEVAVSGDFDSAFLKEIGPPTKGKADLYLLSVQTRAELMKLAPLIARLKPRGVLWVVYPKGITDVREIEVIETGRAAGLKDTKVARFSETHTALRFSQSALPVRSKPESASKAKHAKPFASQ